MNRAPVVLLFAVFVGIGLCAPFATAAIQTLNHVELWDGSLRFRMGMFAPGDAPGGSRQSFINVTLTLQASHNITGTIRPVVMIYPSADEQYLGESVHDKSPSDRRTNLYDLPAYDPIWASKSYCTDAGEIARSFPDNFSLPFDEDYEIARTLATGASEYPSVSMSAQLNISTTGVYYVLISNCAQSSNDSVIISGKITFENPYGGLPGGLWGLLPFYGIALGLFVLVALWWAYRCGKFRRDMLRLQISISVLLGFVILEMAMWLWMYWSYNSSGIRPAAPLALAIGFEVVRKTLSRWLVLVVAMGYTVVKPTLGTTARKIVALCFFYAGFVLVENYMSFFYVQGTLTLAFVLFITFPSTLCDMIFYTWIFWAIAHTIRKLNLRKQSSKLFLYRTLSRVLIFYVIASLGFSIFQIYTSFSRNEDEFWSVFWLFEAFWIVMFFIVFLCIAILWRPSANNARYALLLDSEDPTDDSSSMIENGLGLQFDDGIDDSVGPDGSRIGEPTIRSQRMLRELQHLARTPLDSRSRGGGGGNSGSTGTPRHSSSHHTATSIHDDIGHTTVTPEHISHTKKSNAASSSLTSVSEGSRATNLTRAVFSSIFSGRKYVSAAAPPTSHSSSGYGHANHSDFAIGDDDDLDMLDEDSKDHK